MITRLGTLRDLAPYFLIEPLLPGGTVVALLLWLAQAFVRDGFAGVRQYQHAPRGGHIAMAADRLGSRVSRLCRKSCAVVVTRGKRLVQWCQVTGTGGGCCGARFVA